MLYCLPKFQLSKKKPHCLPSSPIYHNVPPRGSKIAIAASAAFAAPAAFYAKAHITVAHSISPLNCVVHRAAKSKKYYSADAVMTKFWVTLRSVSAVGVDTVQLAGARND